MSIIFQQPPHLKKALGGPVAIGEHVAMDQQTFARIFSIGD